VIVCGMTSTICCKSTVGFDLEALMSKNGSAAD